MTTAAAEGPPARWRGRAKLASLAALAWLALVALAFAPARALRDRAITTTTVPGSESAAVAEALTHRFGSPFAHFAVLVATGLPSNEDARTELLTAVESCVAAVSGVSRVLYADGASDALSGIPNAGGMLIVGLVPLEDESVEMVLERLRTATRSLEPALRRAHPTLQLAWSGEAALNADLRRASAADLATAERRALPLSVVVLLVAFGALGAALVPVLAAVVTIIVALGALSLIAVHMPVSAIAQNVVAMLGLALGIDYSLLMVSRFRRALADGGTPHGAAWMVARTEGRTVLLSAGTVAIGFASLLLVPLPEVRSIAIAGMLVTGSAAAAATTLVPMLLALLGGHVNLGRVRLSPSRSGVADSNDRWRRWARIVAARPRVAIVVATVPLLLLSAQGLRLRSTLPAGRWLPAQLESVRALAALEQMERDGVVHALRVMLELPQGVPALSADGWTATHKLTASLAADPRVAAVRSLPSQLDVDVLDPTVAAMIPVDVLRSFVSRDARLAVVEVAPAGARDGAALVDLVRDLRSRSAADLAGRDDARVLVGGLPAVNADFQQAVQAHTPAVIALVLGATFIVLALVFRSLLIPLKAIALNLLSVGAAFGAVVLMVQDGHVTWLIGLDAPLDGTFAAVPVLVFCIVFGLSMDYEVFLLSRIAEFRRAGLEERAAVVEGLAHTGRVITSAAILMAVVFGAFTLGDFVLMKILGVALATAVLVDALVVRTIVAPALLVLCGRWNWWPGERLDGRS